MAQRQPGSFSSIDYPEPEQSNIQPAKFSHLFSHLYEKIMDVEEINNVVKELDCSQS